MSTPLALIADIGGTHARFALVRPGEAPSDAIVMRCADYAGPAEAASAYLASISSPGEVVKTPQRAAFAVASPIVGDRVDLINSPWRFSITDVREKLGLERLEVINDFTAVALSVPYLEPADLMCLGAALGAPIGVLGPGTGLGVSALVAGPDGRWIALAAEGGHVTMAATDDREAALLSSLRHRFGHVSAERVLSGPGLVNLYEAVAAVSGQPAVYSTPDVISQRALDGSCPLCREALDTFFGMMGTVAGNLALTLGARGGIFVAGGVLPRMKDSFAASAFRRRFEAKGRFQAYLAEIPCALVIHPQPAFAGLASLVNQA